MGDRNKGFHPVLPRMRRDSRVAVFQTAGRWDARKSTELEHLSGGLDVERVEFEVNSIPDMWARPIMFEMALFYPDEKNPLHRRVLGEWRGLLALLALRDLRAMNLTCAEVRLPPPSSEEEDGDGGEDEPARPTDQRRAAPDFLETLSRLAPRKTLASDTTWHALYVLSMRNKPIGITSPTTLVCTATECYGRVAGVPWSDGRFLLDPTDQISFSEKQALAGWLHRLKNKLQQHEGLDSDSKGFHSLLGLLDQYIDDLGGAPENPPSLNKFGLQMTSGIFAYLASAVEGKAEGGSEKSHVRLLPSREPAPAESVLVVDRAVADQWRMAPHDIFVYGTVSLDAAIPFGGLGARNDQLAGQPLVGARIWESKNFFTEKLFVIDQENAFPGALETKVKGSDVLRYNQSQLVTPILPIEKALIDHLGADDLAQNLSFEQTNDGILVRLRLRLAGPDGAGRNFEIRKEYRFKEREVILVGSVPILEVWPNFEFTNGKDKGGKDLAWGAYFTYYDATGVGNAFYAEPYTPGGASAVMQPGEESRTGEVERYVTKMDRYPQVMVCKAPVANPETNRMEMQPAGVILLRKPKKLFARGRAFRVGVDFGTTSTNVYFKSQDTDPGPVVFNDHFLTVTATGAGERRHINLYNEFLPAGKEAPPFLSLFRDFHYVSNPQQLRPLLDGHIYFLDDYKSLRAGDDQVRSDLKWSDDKATRVRVEAFLEQLCMQVAAEAAVAGASSIGWAYSFPTAFSSADSQQGFPEIWAGATRACAEATALGLPAGADIEKKTESVASALFFREHPSLKASTERGTVCIDIGGSTSDIAIWQQNDLRWQTSVRFAGREMFLNYLNSKPEVLEAFGLNVSGLRQTVGNWPAFYAQADALLLDNSDELFRLLPKHVSGDEVRSLVNYLALGLSGLFYYVGSLLNYLAAKEKYTREMPDIYVGGNGSRMFHWLAVGSYDSTKPINALLRSALLRASGFGTAEVFRVHISPFPKAEAAFGLVTGKDLSYSEERLNRVVAGERFVEGGSEKGWDELLSAAQLTAGVGVPQTLERLNDFLAAYNEYANQHGAVVSPFNVDTISMRDVSGRLANRLSDLRGGDTKTSQVEPIFILALKHLLELRRSLTT